jgi:RNA polymerase sigma factor (sigma-70 family)
MTSGLHEKADWLGLHIMPHEPMLRLWLKSRELAGLEVEDIVQDTYTRILSLPSFDHITNPRTYTFSVASSVMMDHLRRSKIVSISAMADIDLLGQIADDPSPERSVVARDELKRLARDLAALPGRVAEVFRLRRIEGLSQRETAVRLGLSESTVEKHMARGTVLMAGWFGDGGNVERPSSKSVHGRLTGRHGKGNS